MASTQAVLLALVVAMVLAWAWRKPIKTAVFGLISRDRQGRLTIALSPARKTGKRRKRRK